MIALTQRLVERDEQIMALQDELDAYDRHQRELEEKLDEKTAQLITLQRITMEQGPAKNEEIVKVIESWALKDKVPRSDAPAALVADENDYDDRNVVNSAYSQQPSAARPAGLSSHQQVYVQREIERQLLDPSLRAFREPLAQIISSIVQTIPPSSTSAALSRQETSAELIKLRVMVLSREPTTH